MSAELVRQSGGLVTVVGTADEVREVVHRLGGEPVSGVQLDGARYRVLVRTLPQRPVATQSRTLLRRGSLRVTIAIGAAAAALVGGIAWAVVYLLGVILAWFVAHLAAILAVFGLFALVLLFGGRGGGGGGLVGCCTTIVKVIHRH